MKTSKRKTAKNQSAIVDSLLRQSKQKRVADRIAALEGLARSSDPRVTRRLIDALLDKSPAVRAAGAEWLGDLNAKEAIKPLIASLSDSDSEVRMTAAASLGDLLTGNKSPRQLTRLLQDPDELVRIEASESLGAIGDRAALPALWRAAKDRSPLVRSYVAGAIGELGTERDIPKLERALAEERSDTVKIGIYQALYKLGRSETLSALLLMLSGSRDYRVRSATAKILTEVVLNQSNSQVIIDALEKALRREPTAAVRSSIRSSLKRVKGQVARK
jgi:HEAT repeat protein